MRRGTEHDRGVERSVWNGAKRLRRSRWERGTRERVARGGVRLKAGAGGYFHEGRLTHVKRAKAIGCRGAPNIKGQARHKHRLPVPGQARNVWGCGQGTGSFGRTSFFPVPVLRTSTTGRTVTFFPAYVDLINPGFLSTRGVICACVSPAPLYSGAPLQPIALRNQRDSTLVEIVCPTEARPLRIRDARVVPN